MVVSALKSDLDCDMALKDAPLPLPKDNTRSSSSLPPSSSGQLLQNILHSDLQLSTQDPELRRPEGITDMHDAAVDLLLGSVNGSILPLWDGEGSPPGSLSGCSSLLLDSEFGDPQYDQSLLENLFYKAPKFDSCLSAGEDEHERENTRLDLDVEPHAGPSDCFPGLSVDRIALLGSIHIARVLILQLLVPTVSTTDTSRKLSGKGRPPLPHATKKCTYFVEYLFPLPAPNNSTGTAAPAEVTRVVSSKIVDEVVKFQHRSIFSVHFDGPSIKRWWDTNLTFTVYSRKSHQMKPAPIGSAVFPLRTLLQSERLSITTELPVQRVDGDKQDIGPLKVSFELATDKKDFASKSKLGKQAQQKVNLSSGQPSDEEISDCPQVNKTTHTKDTSPVAVHSSQSIRMPRARSTSPQSVRIALPKPSDQTEIEESDILLHTLLMVPDGKDFKCAPMQPNAYLNCKFFGSEETTRSSVSWGQIQPTFNLVQVAPVTLTARLLERMRNNVMVIEVWLKASSSDHDKLLGLVKLPLHQFYMSFRDSRISQLLLQAQYPVVAVDSYMPIVDIFTGGTRGSLRVFLAMGTAQQIMTLQRMREEEMSSVSQPSRPVHLLDHRPTADTKANASSSAEALNEHVFLVRIEKVRGLTPLQSTVWGEADCYIQYSFPTQEKDKEEDMPDVDPHVVESTVNVKSYRTATTLCIPDPVFGHREMHVLLAPPSVPVQTLLLSSLASQGLSSGGGIQFEVWCRYYYPNVREQLVAKGLLPMAKLCAMVTMQRQGQTEAQLFSLPLVPRTDKPADVQAQPSGLLEVSVQYKTRPVRSDCLRSGAVASRTVNLVVQVHRAAGLQAAAQSVALQYYSEVGVNSFVTVQLSFLPDRESRSTRVVARSFCPEFEHHTEFCCQLLVQRDSGESVSLAEVLQDAVAVLTVYNRDTRKVVDASRSTDSILGSVRIRLADLLHKRTGISGWYSLSLPPSASSHPSLTSVGGLELSINFGHRADRERVLNSARLMGWEVESDSEEEEQDQDEDYERLRELKLSISMPKAWLPVHVLLLPGHSELQRSTYCYFRYKLYDQEAYCSQLRHPVLEEGKKGQDMATVTFTGTRNVELRRCQPLRWYLREEKLEVQVWVSFGKGKRIRPHDSDRLVGSAFVDLSALATTTNQKQSISGVYPLFKRSAADLSGAALRVHITVTMKSTRHASPKVHPTEVDEEEDEEEQLISPGEEDLDKGPSSRQSHVPDSLSRHSCVSSRQHTKSVQSSEFTKNNTFTATVSVERSMHLSLKGCPLAEKRNSLPSCWVSYATADDAGTVNTAVVQDSDCPVWDHQQECRLSKELLVDPQQLLVFKVWHKGEAERVIGFASVDLSPLLSGFQSVCGWYNITDFSGQCQGQIKVSVSPLMGAQELRAQRQVACENTATDSSSLFGALPLCYQTTAVYSGFPSHISRFPEQRICTPEQDGIFSNRSGLFDHHDEHMDNIRRFHKTLQERENTTTSFCAGDAHPSSSGLFSALRKNLSELDDIQKYFSRKLSTPAFSVLTEQSQNSRQDVHKDSEADTTELLLKSNQLVEEVNGMIAGLSEHQAAAASPTRQKNPSRPAEMEVYAFSGVDHSALAESESFETISHYKDPVPQLEDVSPLLSPASEESSHSPEPDNEDLHLDSPSIEEEDELVDKDDEEFEETLIEPRTLNEVTSVTDRTSPWTSILSDPDLDSVESLEVTEQPVHDLRHSDDRETAVSSPAASMQALPSDTQRAHTDSDLSAGFESDEDAGDAGGDEDSQHVSEELDNEESSFAVLFKRDSTQDPAGRELDSESDSENDSLLPSCSESSIKANGERENEESRANLDHVKIPNFFLPSHHLEASMRALRFAPVFPSTSTHPETGKSEFTYRRANRSRPSVPPKKEETKRIAKIFSTHFTEGS
ncbi:C2 domain-containing protein 3 isoform X1 [Trichomycterus rosablanca]|uniref:C2 domain-containing protein 3 isoform X1 n=1 Tax=Trichomycterus rosablanca TaxID=2290929 RepID=UPI002F35E30B